MKFVRFLLVIAAMIAIRLVLNYLSAGERAELPQGAEPRSPLASPSDPVAPTQRDPRLARILDCDEAAMARATDLGENWWAVLDRHHTEDDLPDDVMLARAEGGDDHAMTVAAFAYLGEAGDEPVGPYNAEGLAWLERAAAAGNITAQNEMGYTYAHGRYGITRDPGQAQGWLEKAVLGGDALAGFTLGELYAEGSIQAPAGDHALPGELGFAADMVSAQRCYFDALNRVAEHLRRGRYLPRDLVTAGFLRRKADAYWSHRSDEG